ncbi:MAG: arylesterase [Magnetovibrio sp.]|nr:arylesterase [Magnetovibrio sp.]
MNNFVNACGVLLIVVFGLWSEDSRADNKAKTILALGDSLTAGYGLAQSDAFPVQLQAVLQQAGHNIEVINGGVSGDTSAGGRSRLEWLLANPVDAVIVELGANDGLRGLDPAETRANLDWIVGTLKKHDIPVLLSGMLAPPNLGEDYGKEFNSIYPDLARQWNVALDPFFLEGVAADPNLNQADGIHPNAKGVSIIVKRILPKILNVLNVL